MNRNNVAYTKVRQVLEAEYMFDLELENGVVIHVRKDGAAVDNSGALYYSVVKEDEDEIEVLGWSSEISKSVTL